MGEHSYKHLGIEQRRCIEHGLNEGRTLTAISRQIGFNVSTVRREILRNRREDGSSRSRGKDKNNCAFLKTCKVRGLCDNGCDRGLCRCCDYPCEAMGRPQYRERACERVASAPFACNGCQRYASCTLPRFKYSAENADATSRRRAREARSGIDLTEGEMALLADTVHDGLCKGQSIHHVFETSELPCSERSFYRYVEDEAVPILSIELAKKVKYKKRKKKAAHHNAGFYAGREYDDFLELPAEERACATEVDTVLGKKGDAPCILSLHRVDLRFQPYLRLPSKTKESVVGALDWLEECCTDPSTGKNCFSELFGPMLLDRGAEFDDTEGMERSCIDPSRKRCACYFADPSRPDRKGACEKNHVELRKVPPKSASFAALGAAALADICSHVNSTVRRGCGNASPIKLAKIVLPQYLLDNLGIREIPAKDVVSAPGILYRPE